MKKKKAQVKKIQVKNKELFNMGTAIAKILKCSVSDGKIVYRLNKLFKVITEHIEVSQKAINGIKEYYADRDEEGKHILNPDKDNPNVSHYQFKENMIKYQKELEKIDEETVELEFIPIKFSTLWKRAKSKDFGPEFSSIIDTIIEYDEEEFEKEEE